MRPRRPLAAPHQRAHQRTAATLAAQRHAPGPQPAAARGHRGQPQLDAPPNTQLAISRRHLHSTHSQPPIELALRPGAPDLRQAASDAIETGSERWRLPARAGQRPSFSRLSNRLCTISGAAHRSLHSSTSGRSLVAADAANIFSMFYKQFQISSIQDAAAGTVNVRLRSFTAEAPM